MTIPSEALRKCKKCGEEKKLTDFYLHSSKKHYHRTCKKCTIDKKRARKQGPEREKILERERKWAQNHRAKIRDEVFAAYGGYKCVCCGETQPLFLTLDHIENDGAEFRRNVLGKRTMAGYHSYQWLKRNGYPKTVQVMCMNCQHGKLMNNGICPHQGTCND